MASKAKMIPRKMLSSDEQVVLETKPTAWLYMKAAVVALVIAIVMFVLFIWVWIPDAPEIPYISEWLEGEYGTYVQAAFGVVAILALFFFFYRWLKWGSTVYAVTDERIITQRGILNKKFEDIPLTAVSNVDMTQSIGKRALGYGTIVIVTQGSSDGRRHDIVWKGVPDPYTVRRRLQEVMDIRVKPKI